MIAKTPCYFNWLSKDLGIAHIRQKEFGKVISSSPKWFVDLRKGIITFGEKEFPVSFLGSESYASNTWLWGWVNVNDYAESVWKDSETFYQRCMMMNMEELREPELELTDIINGHALASMAVVSNQDQNRRIYANALESSAGIIPNEERMCYYKAPYDGGAAFFLIKNVPNEIFDFVPALSAFTAISEIISSFPVHHGYLVDGIMEVFAKEVEKNGKTVLGTFYDGSVLSVEFDDNFRIKKMDNLT